MPPVAAAALMDEMVEEVLLRFPPDEPKHLLRAALVCKRWRRIVSDRRFRRRFCELHRKPRMLGFLYNRSDSSIFVPTCSFRPASAAHRYGPVIDVRHGRVLLLPWFPDWEKLPLDNAFVVWDPITSEWRELPLLPRSVRPADWNAAVLCATAPGGACDHLDCCGGPFLVIFVAMDKGRMFVYAYSSETGAWTEQTSAQHPNSRITLLPSALVGNALYFFERYSYTILRFDLGARELSLIQMPEPYYFGRVVLMITEHGALGFATMVDSKLHLWSREARSEDNARWVQSRVIELKTLFPADILLGSLYVAGFAEGVDMIFVGTNHGHFTIDLKSIRVTKVLQKDIDTRRADIFPTRASTLQHWEQLLHVRNDKCLTNTSCSVTGFSDKRKFLLCHWDCISFMAE